MKIHAGYEISYNCLQPTPMILTLNLPEQQPVFDPQTASGISEAKKSLLCAVQSVGTMSYYSVMAL